MIHSCVRKLRRSWTFACTFTLISSALLAAPAFAGTLCDLIPAPEVKSTLGITDKLSAKPKGETSLGCLYKGSAAGPVLLVADASDASGMRGTMFEQRLTSLGADATLIPGLGEAAYYSETDNEQIAKFPGGTFTQQSIVFRAKGKIISLVITTRGSGIPKEALQSLATLAASKPLDSLIDPSN